MVRNWAAQRTQDIAGLSLHHLTPLTPPADDFDIGRQAGLLAASFSFAQVLPPTRCIGAPLVKGPIVSLPRYGGQRVACGDPTPAITAPADMRAL